MSTTKTFADELRVMVKASSQEKTAKVVCNVMQRMREFASRGETQYTLECFKESISSQEQVHEMANTFRFHGLNVTIKQDDYEDKRIRYILVLDWEEPIQSN